MRHILFAAASLAFLVTAADHAQVPQPGRGGAPAGLPALPPLMQTPPKPIVPSASPVRSCESLAMVALPNTIIESATVDAANPGVCRVTAITTHPPAGDKVTVWIAIPTLNWNGRFLGNGGGGFVGGSAAGVNQGVALGFAAGATDAGHEGGSASFALDANGRTNWQAIRDFAHVGIHEMTVTGKALAQAMYGVAPRYSYFNGCSTGGRQGLMEAQRYPQDYNGIAAAAPAINWTNLMMQSMWGSMLMNTSSNPIASCKLAVATTSAIAACDGLDGVKDGVIEDPVGMEISGLCDLTGPFTRGPLGDKFKLEELKAAEALLFGRLTYDAFAAVWPSVKDEAGFAERINSLPKYVASSTLKEVSWNATTVIGHDLVAETTALKSRYDGDILIYGSASIVHALAPHDLIDEYRLMVYPTLLGRGKRLFAANVTSRLMLSDCRQFDDGIVLLSYRAMPPSN